MTDTWTFKLPDDKTCWEDLKEYAAADTDCATALTAAADKTMPAALKEAEWKVIGAGTADTDPGVLLKTCGEKSMVYHTGVKADAAAATGAAVVTVTYGDKLKDGVVTCAPLATGGNLVSFTIKGYSKAAAADETSGAMSLASAVAAGALAVAATQF